MFSGMTNHSIDAKGRIVLPAKFREELGNSFYLAKGFKTDCIQAVSCDEFERLSENIRKIPATYALQLQYRFNGSSVEVTPNAQGRVIIPQSLREFAEIDKDALVIGMDKRIEIWNKDRFEAYMASQQDTLAEALSMLQL